MVFSIALPDLFKPLQACRLAVIAHNYELSPFAMSRAEQCRILYGSPSICVVPFFQDKTLTIILYNALFMNQVIKKRMTTHITNARLYVAKCAWVEFYPKRRINLFLLKTGVRLVKIYSELSVKSNESFIVLFSIYCGFICK